MGDAHVATVGAAVVPDLIFRSDNDFTPMNERGDFRDGLYKLPARFQRTFLSDTIEDGKLYQAGEVVNISVRRLHSELGRYLESDESKELPRREEILSTLISPKSIKTVRYNHLGYAITPLPQYHHSMRRLRWNALEPEEILNPDRDAYDPVQTEREKLKERQMREKAIDERPLRLSHIVKYLMEKHGLDESSRGRLDILLSSCRSSNTKKQMKPTAMVNVNEARAGYRFMRGDRHHSRMYDVPTYMLTCHGKEDHEQFTLPHGVRVFMMCRQGRPMLATVENEARLWFASTFSKYDGSLEFVRDLRLHDDDGEIRQLCVFGQNVEPLNTRRMSSKDE